jgi:hypothetical protein
VKAAFWPSAMLGAMWIALGVHQIVFAGEVQEQLDERNLKWSFGSRYDRRWWQGARGLGFLYILAGATWVLMGLFDTQEPDPALFRWAGVFLIAIGLWGLLLEHHVVAWWRQKRRGPAAQVDGGTHAASAVRAGTQIKTHSRPTASRQWHDIFTLFFGASFLVLANLI